MGCGLRPEPKYGASSDILRRLGRENRYAFFPIPNHLRIFAMRLAMARVYAASLGVSLSLSYTASRKKKVQEATERRLLHNDREQERAMASFLRGCGTPSPVMQRIVGREGPSGLPPKGAICKRGSASREGRWTTRLAACRAAHLGPPQTRGREGRELRPSSVSRT